MIRQLLCQFGFHSMRTRLWDGTYFCHFCNYERMDY